MIQLKPLELIAVSVPEDARNFKITHNSKSLLYEFEVGVDYVEFKTTQVGAILGCVTKDNIDFDVVPYLPLTVEIPKNLSIGRLCTALRKQKQEYNNYFRSLLTANNLHFENPYGDMPNLEPECCGFIEFDEMGFPNCCCQPNPTPASIEQQAEWQTAEEQLIQKLVILKPI